MERTIKRKGFTIIELLIAIAIFSLVVGLIYGIFISGRRTQTTQEELIGISHEAKMGLQQFIREIRMAGSPAGVKACEGANAQIMLISVNPSDVEFEGDVDLDGVLERVRYFYDAPNRTLVKWSYNIADATTGWNTNPARCGVRLVMGNPAGISVETVSYGVDAFSLRYFNDKGEETAALSSITKILMTVTTKSETNLVSNKTITVEIKLPNLGTKATGAANPNPPAQVQGVQIIDLKACGYMKVTWTANTEPDLDRYKVQYKHPSETEWRSGPIVNSGVTSVDIKVPKGEEQTTYIAMVTAANTSARWSVESTPSAPVTLADGFDPVIITGISATKDDSTNKITLTWAAGSDVDKDGNHVDSFGDPYDLQGYYVYRDTDAAFAADPAPEVVAGPLSPISNTTYTDTVSDKCKTYYYKIESKDRCSKSSMSNVYSSVNTMIFQASIDPPQTFYPGAGTTSKGNPNNYYARFSGQAVNDNAAGDIVIEYKSGASCPGPITAKGQGTQLPTGGTILDLDPSPVSPGSSFTGSWDGVAKNIGYYRFAAFTKSNCGEIYSSPFDPGYCVNRCTDSPTYPGGNGLGDSCVYNLTNPITARVCSDIKLYWMTKDGSGNPPATCTAYGQSAENDFYPDQGDGGYMIFRGVDTDGLQGGETYRMLAPDPVTGPIQPFYYLDPFLDLTIPECEKVSATDTTYYRDRCSYRYKIKAVDCVKNQSALDAVQTGNAFSPGLITTPANSLVLVTGAARNKVVFFVQNTAATTQTWKKARFEWKDANARLSKVEICNSEPGIPAGSCTNWHTLWSYSGGVISGSTVDFANESPTLAASPQLGAGNAIKAKMRLTFQSAISGGGQRMDDNSEKITIHPTWVNSSSTVTDKTCPPADGLDSFFEIIPVASPEIAPVKQNPPNQSASGGDDSITAAPPAPDYLGNYHYRSYNYDSTYYWYFVDNVSTAIMPVITPNPLGLYPVRQCGDTSSDKGVLLYYKTTSNTATVAPMPVDGSGNLSVLDPVNYTKMSMCNQYVAGPCSSGSCTYLSNIPALDGKRVWYYIIASDENGNYSISPDQPYDTTWTAYTYDVREMTINEIWVSGINFTSGSLYIWNVWTSRISNASGADPADTATAGTTSTIVVSGVDAITGAPWQETVTKTTIAGCPGCWGVESGFSTQAVTSPVFAAPTPTSPINIKITNTKAGLTPKTCEWNTYNGTTLVQVGNDPECKP